MGDSNTVGEVVSGEACLDLFLDFEWEVRVDGHCCLCCWRCMLDNRIVVEGACVYVVCMCEKEKLKNEGRCERRLTTKK